MIYLISWFVPVQRHTWRSQWFVSLWPFPPLSLIEVTAVSMTIEFYDHIKPLSLTHSHTHTHLLALSLRVPLPPSHSTHTRTKEGLYWYTLGWQLPCSFQKGDPAEREREEGRGRGDREWESGRERERETPLCPPFNLCLGLHFIPWFVSLSTIFKIRPS